MRCVRLRVVCKKIRHFLPDVGGVQEMWVFLLINILTKMF